MKQTLYKLEHCNLGEEVDSDVARKTSAANALMSDREKRKLQNKTQCREREREIQRERERKYFRLENATQAAKVLHG